MQSQQSQHNWIELNSVIEHILFGASLLWLSVNAIKLILVSAKNHQDRLSSGNCRRINFKPELISLRGQRNIVKMDAKPRSRANSVIGQIKWWASSTNNNNNNSNNQNNNNNNSPPPAVTKQFGSSVAVQKLRETKWFGPDENRIFCAVIECGFIVETREGQENDGWFGVANCKTTKGKLPWQSAHAILPCVVQSTHSQLHTLPIAVFNIVVSSSR